MCTPRIAERPDWWSVNRGEGESSTQAGLRLAEWRRRAAGIAGIVGIAEAAGAAGSEEEKRNLDLGDGQKTLLPARFPGLEQLGFTGE